MHKINRIQRYLIILLALVLQTGCLNSIKISGAKPDMMLISVVFFATFLGSGVGVESGLLAGFLLDIFTFDFFFANTLTLGLTGLLAGLASDKFFRESKKAEFLAVAVFTALSMSFHYIIVSFFSRPLTIGYPEFFITVIIPASVYSGLVSIPVYSLLLNIYNLKEANDYL